MTKIIVRQDYRKLSTFLKTLSKSAVKSTVRRSIKRTLTSVRAYGAKEFRAQKLMKASAQELKSKIAKYEHTSGSIAEMYGKIWLSGRDESLSRFFPKLLGRASGNSPRGVQVSVLGQTFAVARGFLWQRPGAKSGVILARLGRGRLPLEKQKGPGVASLAEQSGLLPRLEAKARDTYQKEFNKNLEFYAAKAVEKAKGGK